MLELLEHVRTFAGRALCALALHGWTPWQIYRVALPADPRWPYVARRSCSRCPAIEQRRAKPGDGW